MMTVKEIAEYLQISPGTVYKLSLQGKLPMFPVGNTWRARKEDLDRWMDESLKEKENHNDNQPVR